MTSERDIERVLDHWFTERPTQVADRVLDQVADRIARQPQQRAWRVLRRDSHVNTNLKALLAIAAVIVVAVAGFAVLQPPSGSNVGGAVSPPPAASPTSPASPSSAASTSTVFPGWFTEEGGSTGVGILPPGSQATKSFRPSFTFSVPEGWVNHSDEDGQYGLFPDTPANQAEFARSGALAQSIYMGPHDSPWFICEPAEDNQGATAAEMVAAAVANDALAVSGQVDVEIGGLTGKQFDVRLDPDWTGTCPQRSDDPPTKDIGDTRVRAILLDTPGAGVIVIFIDSWTSADSEAFFAGAMPIVESFDFDLTP
jgi:hypothetical protein